jgi:hypothetical protein
MGRHSKSDGRRPAEPSPSPAPGRSPQPGQRPGPRPGSRPGPRPGAPARPRSSELQAEVPEFLHNDPSMSGPITHTGAWKNWWEETGSQPPIPADAAPNAFPLRSVPGPAPAPAPRSRRARRDDPSESFDDLRAPEPARGSRIDSSSGTYSRLRPPPETPSYPRPGTPSYGLPDAAGPRRPGVDSPSGAYGRLSDSSSGLNRLAPPRRPDDSGRIDSPSGAYGRLPDSRPRRPEDSSTGLNRLDPGRPRRPEDSSTGLNRLDPRRAEDSSTGLNRLDPARPRRAEDSGRLDPAASSTRLRPPEEPATGRRRAASDNQLGSIDGGHRARRGGATRSDLVQGSTALAPTPDRDRDEITDTGARRARSTFHVAEEPEAYDEPSLVLQWGVFLLQTLTAAAVGLGVWLGFYRLWSTWPFYAAPAVGAAMVGMLAVARLLRRRYGHELDLLTAVVTVAVGTVLTVLPAAFTVQSIA